MPFLTEHATQDRPLQSLEAILDAAEIEFSLNGFSGAGLKAISTRAEVSQALVHYHYGNKDGLYSAVVRRRSQIINNQRLAQLDAVELTAPGAMDEVLSALVRAPLGPNGGGGAYARIFAGLIVGQERDRALVRETYDPVAVRFVDAIAIAGDLPRTAAGLGYVMTLGTLISVIARDGRPERLMGRDEPAAIDELVSWISAFARGGIETLRMLDLTAPHSQRHSGRNE